MAHQYRNMSIPYTEEEIAEVVEACKKFKSFENNSFGSADLGTVCEVMRYERTAEQIQAFVDYYEKYMGGRLSLKGIEEIMRTQHNASLHAGWYAGFCDSDKDGFISKCEFERVYDLMSSQWPKVAGKTYDDLVGEADADKSDAVSVEEFVNWLEANSN